MSNDDHPPTLASFINNINLESIPDSKIACVSVYPSRAEVTRIFKLSVKPGQNLVKINGLPNDLKSDSVRVEGRGLATIHDVTVGAMPVPPELEIPVALSDLEERKKRIEKALERNKKMSKAVETYLSTLQVGQVKADELDKLLEGCDMAGAKLDDKILDLKKQRMTVEKEIHEQQKSVGGDPRSMDRSRRLRTMISLSLFAEKASEVELVLIYAVLNASWRPIYDVRVDTQGSEMPVTLVYKAAIRQNTAEDWENVSLTLETATPTFQVGIPTLDTWTLSVFRPPIPTIQPQARSLPHHAPQTVPVRAPRRARRSRSSDSSSSASDDGSCHPLYQISFKTSLPPPMNVLVTSISSKGNVSATFTVPGNITVPSDNADHNVTVTQLDLDASMSWVAVPKLDTKTRLSAKIKNASEYTLLGGVGSIYVDGSFIAKSDIPAVSPGESFNCALGLDPAIRVTYHPVSKKLSKTGFYNKHHVHSCSQRISVYNTKSIPIKDLRIMDQIPVSADETITVKLLTPSLSTVPSRFVGSVKGEKKAEQPVLHSKVPVSPGIVAGWGHDIEDTVPTEDGTTVAGQDGKLSWVCEIPPQGRVNLLLQWEVTSPASTPVRNL